MWNLVWNPVRFFEARRHRHADWITALAAPALCAGLQGVSVSIFSGKTRPDAGHHAGQARPAAHGAPVRDTWLSP